MKISLTALVAQLVLCSTGSGLLAQTQPGTVLWSLDLGSPIRSSPVLGPDGTAYVATASGGLYAVTNSGTSASNKWAFAASISYSSPAVAADGTIYLASSDGNLYAIGPTGSSTWSYPAQCSDGSPAVGSDGTIYVEGYSYLHAVAPDGGIRWKALVGDAGNFSAPAIAPDGTVYITSSEWNEVHAFAADGSQKWVVKTSGVPGKAVAIAGDGTIYLAAGPLYALSPDGTTLWELGSGSLFDGLPVTGAGGTTYIGAYGSHTLYAVSAAGQEMWHTLSAGRIPSTTGAAVDASGTVYYCASNSVWALSPQGQVKWSVYGGIPAPGIDGAQTSPAVSNDGVIYAALGTKLYAIVSGTNDLASSSWPMYQQNPRHTGKVEKPLLKIPQKRIDANFQFQLFPPQLGLAYNIEISTNLSDWTSLTSIVATTLPTKVADLTATNVPFRFYRAVSVP